MSHAMLAKKAEAAPAAPSLTIAKNSSSALRIGAPDDAFEQEADRVADAVIAGGDKPPRQWSLSRMSIDAPLQRQCACGGSAGAGGQCEECKEKTSLQRKAAGAKQTNQAPPIVHEVLGTPGRPLDRTARAFFDARFGYDFSRVRIHSDAKAAESARAVNARAYTVGRDIVLDAERFTPNTPEGQRLIAHELAHVVQQNDARIVRRDAIDAGTPAQAAPTADPQSAVDAGAPATATPAPGTVCGPDATDWFINQVSAAKRDPTVLAIQQSLLGAHRVAAKFGFSAERVAEGGVAKKVLSEETAAGSPARTPEAKAQIAASAPGQREFGRAVAAALAPLPFVGAPEQIVLLEIRRAANAWVNLVGTKKRYDFKNDTRTMKGPTSDHCPVQCANTITLCPSTGSDCFQTDVPGNLFYAHLGKFIGWTELSLQLGSEYAQLASTKTWDPPEDTRMISIGFALPDPLTRADLCSAVKSNRTSFTLRPCNNCSEATKASVV
jgi:hypothetical protein